MNRSIICFPASDNRPRSQQNRSRKPFPPEEREKVRKVRQQGACLRCRLLRIRCASENPCKSCLESALRGSERKVLSFCYCIRSRFADVNIFYSDQIANMQIETFLTKMSGLLARIALPASFGSFNLERANFNDTLEKWLTDPGAKFPNGSIVALCCSNLLSIHFQEELLDDHLLPEFQKFLLATTLAHSGWHAREMKRMELCAAGHISGYRLIKRLDRVLTPQFLSQCSQEYCQVLFLLVLGTILGVGYSSSQLTETESPSFPAAEMLDTEFQQSPTLWLAMKEHLCQMLAHHLIFLGSQLGIKLETEVERRIIETASHRWSKMESYVWADGIPPVEKEEEESLSRRLVDFTDPSVRHQGGKQPEPILYNGVSNDNLNPPYWQQQETGPSTNRTTPNPPPLVPISCPEIAQLQTSFPQWSENPSSYLSMDMEEPPPPSGTPPAICDEPEHMGGWAGNSSIPNADRAIISRSQTDPLPPGRQDCDFPVPWRRVKRRSMWVVRSYDAGPERGLINVHARLRGREVPRDFGLFV